MKCRTFIRLVKKTTLSATCLWLALLCTAVDANQRPNVVILLADDLGSKDIGCYGGPVATPAVDGLAAKGVRFTGFYSGAPVCSPSRATLLTGRQHMRTGVYTVIQDHMHDMHLLKSEVTIAEVLKSNGYDTAHIGKWHVGTPFRGRDKPWIEEHGFDYWFATDLNASPSHRNPSNFWRNGKRVGELEGYACQIVVDEAITWLDQKRDSKRPFFLNIWFHEPHAPLAAPDDIVAQYGDHNDPAAIYSGTIDNTDRAIARLLKKLNDDGELENTIIIYASDHGSYRPDRNGGLRGNKGSLFEGGIRTPGIFYWPKGIKGGRLEDAPAGAVDLLPTICGLLGIAKPKGVHLDGSDLSPLLTGSPDKFTRHQPLFWHSPNGQPNVAIREGKYTLMGYRKLEFPKDQEAIRTVMNKIEALLEKKLGRELTRAELWNKAYNTDFKTPEGRRLRSEFVMLNTFQEAWIPLIKAGSGGFQKFELYDLSTDPNQTNDIASQFPKVVERLVGRALAINASVLKEASNWGQDEPALAAGAKPPTNPRPSLEDADLEKLLTRIDATDLPEGYHGSTHQAYVDKRMAALAPEQRVRVGTLYEEKRRLHPNMPNAGMSFVKILEYVVAGETLKTKPAPEPAAPRKRHLFILSGQSNMEGLDPSVSFTPAVQRQFGTENVIVVKLAQGGQPIRRWYKNWKSANGTPSKDNGDLYDRLMGLVKKSIEGQDIVSVTFVWMQGERDAKTKELSVYGSSLVGLVEQLHNDLGRKDVNVVIGKLGKGQLEGKPWSEDWASLRKVQEDLCKADPRWEIVDCDDLEMRGDNLHFSADGYKGMGKRFAAKAIQLIESVESSRSATIHGQVVDPAGKPMQGVMVSAFDEDHRKWTSVFSQSDGSYAIDGLRDTDHTVRARLMGQLDEWIEDVEAGAGETELAIRMEPATGADLEDQRPANSAFGMLKFENAEDKQNFKMFCAYCHQIGTIGFRTPEKPVDWETMLRRMDGFGGLYRHTQKTIVPRLVATYKDDAIKEWPIFVPPPAPTGLATKAKITMWEIDERDVGAFHDMEVGAHGMVYAVHIGKQYTVELDTATDKQTFYKLPRQSYGPHSIELANDGNMWITLCVSGQMARFNPRTKEYLVCSSAEAPAARGSFPHTLRINPSDPEGLIWYTDAGRNSCFSLHPKTLVVKEYHLLSAGQAVAAGKGESRGITPYGLDFSPVDGMIWYSKLNGNRIGRLDPNAPDGDIKEWNPPFRGPRRLHVAPDGMVWVPGFGSGVFGKFDPKKEAWTVYDLPDAENQIPYALNVDAKGYVWICGTGNDTLNRFDPETEELVEFRLPMRVCYTREIEFDSEGNIWTSTSGPARHMERGFGAIIKLELPKNAKHSGGIKLVARTYAAHHQVGNQLPDFYKKSPNGKLFAEIDGTDLPDGYTPQQHQNYVDKRMAGLSEAQRNRIGRLWQERRKIDPNMGNVGQTFVRIMEHVAKEKAKDN